MSDRPALSAIVLTCNEERRIERTLASLAWADEILLLDSGSRDRTPEIARARGARFETRTLDNFAAQRNHAARLARHDWVLMIDADEVVSDELRGEIERLLRDGPTASAYAIPRWNILFGKRLRHGGHAPDYNTRLYHREHARYVGDVHERLEADGTLGRLQGHLVHYSTATIGEYLAKLQLYTDLEARELRRERGKARPFELFLLPALWFWRAYVLQRGFLDGFQGYLACMLGSFYVFIKHAKRNDAVGQSRDDAEADREQFGGQAGARPRG